MTPAPYFSAIRGAFSSDRFAGEQNADALRNNESLRQRVWDLVASTHLDDSEVLLAGQATVEDMLEAIDLGGRGMSGPEGRIWMLDPIDGTAKFLCGE